MEPSPKPRFQFSLRQAILGMLFCATLLYALLGRETWRLRTTVPGLIFNAQTALTLDDSKILTRQKSSICVFDTGSGAQLLSIQTDPSAEAISLDGRFVAVGTNSGTIELWNVASGTKTFQWDAHKGAMESVSFSGDARYLISSSTDLVARVWDVETGKVTSELKGHTGLIERAYLNSDGSYALTESDHGWGRSIDPADQSKILWGDKTARIWDTHTQQELKRGTRWFEETPKATIIHEALTPEDYKPYETVQMSTRDGRMEIIRPSYGSPWCIYDRDAHTEGFEFKSCVGRFASAFFGHNEDIIVTSPLESRVTETSIWQNVNSSKYSRLIYRWMMRLLGVSALFVVIRRLQKWRKARRIRSVGP